jgi:hypothetical protein
MIKLYFVSSVVVLSGVFIGLVVAVAVSFLIVSIVGGVTTAGVSAEGSFLAPPLLQLTAVNVNRNTPRIIWMAVFGILLVIF